jgi:phenylalanyl-tRNA synthetase alpha chain
MNLTDLKKQVDEGLRGAKGLEEVERLGVEYLGKKGQLNKAFRELMKKTGDKKQLGQEFNRVKSELEELFEKRMKELSGDKKGKQWLDVTMPGGEVPLGRVHPISQAIEEISRIFKQIGFTRVRYPEVDWDWYVFEALNFSEFHPARDDWETLWIDAPRHKEFGVMVLSTHTSNGQVREMERVGKPPIRMINIAKCYRRQQDVTHTAMFHQFEGLVVDKGINIRNLKGTIDYFARKFYGSEAKSRIRPYNFPFTEPSFEVDFSCTNCQGTGTIKGEKCRFCKSGWHEVGGAGMVHPQVLENGGVDPNVYTGFAFGWGVERSYTLKPGLKLDDVRLLYSNRMEFLRQF